MARIFRPSDGERPIEPPSILLATSPAGHSSLFSSLLFSPVCGSACFSMMHGLSSLLFHSPHPFFSQERIEKKTQIVFVCTVCSSPLLSSSPPLLCKLYFHFFFFFSSQPDLFSRIWCVSLCLRGHSVESTTFFLLIFMQVAPAERPVNSLYMRHQLYSLETRPYVITPASASLSLLSFSLFYRDANSIYSPVCCSLDTALALNSQLAVLSTLGSFFFPSPGHFSSLSLSLSVPSPAHIKVLCYANTLLSHGPVLIYVSLLFFFLSLSPLGNLLSQQ